MAGPIRLTWRQASERFRQGSGANDFTIIRTCVGDICCSNQRWVRVVLCCSSVVTICRHDRSVYMQRCADTLIQREGKMLRILRAMGEQGEVLRKHEVEHTNMMTTVNIDIPWTPEEFVQGALKVQHPICVPCHARGHTKGGLFDHEGKVGEHHNEEECHL